MRRRGALAAAGLALVAAGCGGGGESPGAGSDSPSSSPSSSDSTPSDAPEPEPTPTVEPATGVEIELKGFRVNAPKKWRINNEFLIAATAIGPVDDGRSGGMLLGLVPSSEQVSIAASTRKSWQPGAKPRGFEEQPRTVLGGLSAFYYTAEANKFLTEHVMGTWDSGWIVELNIQLPNALSAERQTEIVDSIVATYQSPSPRDG
ncbi:hypothetical protein [Nocardioides zhouii]|uniref:Uncharacterized protein n=1 Tax=Nocardioides zhouii TaxID=1168729 RepID=A0A4Q2T6C6_9ACTN|nr:hypothetical protein [Nocardioides zhouii]RYC12508.1 hypothetical protein EUA94_07500 [Nocardioides zhouii]